MWAVKRKMGMITEKVSVREDFVYCRSRRRPRERGPKQVQGVTTAKSLIG